MSNDWYCTHKCHWLATQAPHIRTIMRQLFVSSCADLEFTVISLYQRVNYQVFFWSSTGLHAFMVYQPGLDTNRSVLKVTEPLQGFAEN